MNVTRKRHFLTVLALLAVILVLTALLIVIEFNTTKDERRSDEPHETPATESTKTPFLQEEEVVVIESTPADGEVILPVEEVLFEYVEVTDSCGIHYGNDCVLVRSGPGTDFPIIARLRNDVVLKIDGKVEHDGHSWYKIVFDEVLKYPERVTSDWYVAADYVEVLLDGGDKTVWEDGSATTTKHIVVDVALQKLYAYDGEVLFMETAISTGLELSPTPRGTFTVFKKTPSRYMQGPLPGYTDFYDLPGVPWNLYFTHEGAVIHGAYWHDSFGSRYSHGCVNLPPDVARTLYNWAVLGTKVTVR